MVTEKENQNRIEAIELRNKEVELNKDWEQSYTRKFLIVLFTASTFSRELKAILTV